MSDHDKHLVAGGGFAGVGIKRHRVTLWRGDESDSPVSTSFGLHGDCVEVEGPVGTGNPWSSTTCCGPSPPGATKPPTGCDPRTLNEATLAPLQAGNTAEPTNSLRGQHDEYLDTDGVDGSCRRYDATSYVDPYAQGS